MKKQRMVTTFSKMTVSFVCFGLVPLLLLSILFFCHYNGMLRDNMISSYSTMNGYVTRSVGDIIHNVDDAMGELYDYQNIDGETLDSTLKDRFLNRSEREHDLQDALRAVMFKSRYISSLRFVDFHGKIYSLYYSQDKVLRNTAASYTTMDLFKEDDPLTGLKVFGTIPEEEICINSDDYVFGLARNYMDTSTVDSTHTRALGTLFADINVETIEEIVDKAAMQKGDYYVYVPEAKRYIYSGHPEHYRNGAHPLEFCEQYLKDDSGYSRIGSQWVFYEKIKNMDIYGVLVLNHRDVMGNMFQSRVLLILILCFASGFLLILYTAFSIAMSEPTKKLKTAMDQVREGNLDVRVELNTNDEMEYVADGFNDMVEKLGDYINQVYVAKICQKDAELNALKMQIQPHYLYNTLDVIRMTALEHDDMETAKLLESLAHQLRYVMGNQSDRIRLKDELDAIREYFVIMKARYEGRISLMVSVDDRDCDLVILKMLLQPLVENAIRHGLREKEGPGTVAVCVERKADYLEIIVMDDGIGMDEEQVKYIQDALEQPNTGQIHPEGRISVGMKNVYDRIKLNCGAEYGYSVQSTLGVGTILTCKLPIWEDEETCGK